MQRYRPHSPSRTPLSKKDNLEYAGLIYKAASGGYHFTKAEKGSDQGANPYSSPAPAGTTVAWCVAKWVHVAEPAFERAHLNLDSYIISVVEQGDSAIVMLDGLDSVKGRGETRAALPDTNWR